MHSFYPLLYWAISFVIAFIIAGIALALIIQFMDPQFRNDDGSVNWGTAFWVAALQIIFIWIILWIIYWIVDIFMTPCGAVVEPLVVDNGCPIGAVGLPKRPFV